MAGFQGDAGWAGPDIHDAFPTSNTYEVDEPDEFLVLLDDSIPEVVHRVTADQSAYWCSKRGGSMSPRVPGACRMPGVRLPHPAASGRPQLP